MNGRLLSRVFGVSYLLWLVALSGNIKLVIPLTRRGTPALLVGKTGRGGPVPPGKDDVLPVRNRSRDYR
jgi:hypothetical protein